MWGDPERACRLASFDVQSSARSHGNRTTNTNKNTTNDPLAHLLFQICSPAHIPWGDSRWQELLHGYNVWIHISDYYHSSLCSAKKDNDRTTHSDSTTTATTTLLHQACTSMAKHAGTSSNLAALALHVSRIIRDLIQEIKEDDDSTNDNNLTNRGGGGIGTAPPPPPPSYTIFSKRISRVAKARATAGGIQLLLLLLHPVVVRTTTTTSTAATMNSKTASVTTLPDALLYHTRGDLPRDKDAGPILVHATLDFLCSTAQPSALSTPEVYDTVVLCFHLIFVLCGTQLYQNPFVSSIQQYNQQPSRDAPPQNDHFALNLILNVSKQQQRRYRSPSFPSRRQRLDQRRRLQQQQQQLSKSSSTKRLLEDNYRQWTCSQLLEVCMEWILKRPPPPERSLALYYAQLHQSVVASQGARVGPDGMYESQHVLVQATSPNPTMMMQYHHHHPTTTTTAAAGTDPSNHSYHYPPPTSSSTLHPSSQTMPLLQQDSHAHIHPHHHPHQQQQPSSKQYHQHHSTSNILLDATKGVLVLSSTIILLPLKLLTLVFGVFGDHSSNSHSFPPRNALLAQAKLSSSSSSRTKDVLWLSDSIVADMASCFLLLLLNNQRRKRRLPEVRDYEDDGDSNNGVTNRTNGTIHEENDEDHGDDDDDDEDDINNRSKVFVETNPFRKILSAVRDNRWEPSYMVEPRIGTTLDSTTEPSSAFLPDLPVSHFEQANSATNVNTTPPLESNNATAGLNKKSSSTPSMSLNFESLFLAFGRTLHTEVGALLLYTMLQCAPAFAESLVVRSDLDTLILPLLRTLYFASSSRLYVTPETSSGHRCNSKEAAFQVDSSKSSQLHPHQFNHNTSLSNRSLSRATSTPSTNTSTSRAKPHDIRTCPFRSQSQLYVIIILLLIFSQDTSFGNDAFRRCTVPHVLWYKERNLKQVNLGSILVLTLLRTLLFTLQRTQDSFLLSNCCAILLNLAPAMTDLHDYAAIRLASVTVTVLKQHAKLRKTQSMQPQEQHQQLLPSNYTGVTQQDDNLENDGYDDSPENDLSTPLGMYAEVGRTLLTVLKHCLSSKNLERNIHLVYALVYHQHDLQTYLFSDSSEESSSEVEKVRSSSSQPPLSSPKERSRIQSVTSIASTMLLEQGTRSATKALAILESRKGELLELVEEQQRLEQRSPSPLKRFGSSDDSLEQRRQALTPEFTFTYEEEADPEIFFVPYVWEVIVCVVTSSLIDWDKNRISVFPLLEEQPQSEPPLDNEPVKSNFNSAYFTSQPTDDSTTTFTPSFGMHGADMV